MHAAPVGATTQTKLSDSIPLQPTTIHSDSGSQGAVVQNRSASSDPRGTLDETLHNAIDPAESSAPTVKATSPSDAIYAHAQAASHFHQRVKAGALDEVKMLLRQSPAFCSAVDEQTGLTPLCMAAMHGRTDIATLLLSAGARVDGRERHGSTPLMFAAQAGHVQMIRLLFEYGANFNAVNQQMSRCVLVWAISERQLDACKVLIEAGADFQFTTANTSGTGEVASPLDMAIVRGWTELIQWLIESKRLSIESEVITGTTLLNFACFTGSLESVRFLLDAGANATAKYNLLTDTLRGPLWYADINQQFHVVEYLLNRGICIPQNLPSSPLPGEGFIYHPAADSGSHANQHGRTQLAQAAVLKDPFFLKSPQKLIEGLADKKIDLMPNEKKWTHWLSELGISIVITHEIFKRISNAAVVFRALAGSHASTSREQYLQALADLVSEACMSSSLNAPFSNFKLTARGEMHMTQLVHRQRALLLQAVVILGEQQLQRLMTLPDLCFNAYISTSHQLQEASLYKFLTRKWGLYDPVALAVIRLIKTAYEKALRAASSGSMLPLTERMRHALTTLLEGLRESNYLPEFAEAFRNLGAHVNKSEYSELIFSQWRLFNEAYQVEINQPSMTGPIRPAVADAAQ